MEDSVNNQRYAHKHAHKRDTTSDTSDKGILVCVKGDTVFVFKKKQKTCNEFDCKVPKCQVTPCFLSAFAKKQVAFG